MHSLLRTTIAVAGAGLALGAPAATAQIAPTPPAETPIPETVEVVEGRALVRFDAGVDERARERVLAAAGVRVEAPIGLPDAYEVAFDEALDEHAVARALSTQHGVRWAEPDVVGDVAALPALPSMTPDDARFGAQWPLFTNFAGHVQAPRAWAITGGVGGADGPLVAVIDTGVDFTHPELAGAFRTNPGEDQPGLRDNAKDDDGNGYVDDWRGYDFGSGDADPTDSLEADAKGKGHGTDVAGVIAARADAAGTTGLLRSGGNLLAIKVANAKGRFTAGKVASAIVYAKRRGADIANTSLTIGAWTNAVSDAITFADDVLVVAGAGNDGVNLKWQSRYPCESNHANVLCVAASGKGGERMAWTNYGPEVDIAAPGDFMPVIRDPNPNDDDTTPTARGTSIAAPIVSATAALLWSMNPSIEDPAQRVDALRARQLILQTAVPHPTLSGHVTTGGRLDAFGALQALAVEAPDATTHAPIEVDKLWAKVAGTVDHDGVALVNVGYQWREKAKPGEVHEVWYTRTGASLDAGGGTVADTLILPKAGTAYEVRYVAHDAYGADVSSPWVGFSTKPAAFQPDGPGGVTNPPKPTH